ncbi:cytochrome P450 [Rubrobacter tropicus]|uniref:Cytochrome P450 n=1 Tax=Rubrobacter tropicus TaxID=2653851 RepID=A0A6G8Q781_9ACTN|nr:cytochrome P450 [Rubrobacter tropicus]QIN82320.1 cytochrome P450 [Rubrobacter tropicus]
MTERIDARETDEFFLNVPEKLDDPFPDLAYFRENRPIFYHETLDQWFAFGHEDVSKLFSDPRMSADRMKGFVDAAPEEVREDLRKVAPYLEMFVLMNDEPDHARLRKFLHRGFNAEAIRGLRGQIQQIADELLDRVRETGRLDDSADFAFLLPAYVLSDFLGFPEKDRDRVVQWSVDFIGFFNVVPITVETTRDMVRSATEMIGYTKELLAERREHPREDFLGLLAGADPAEISEEEVVANAMLLLLAGHVAPRNLIGNAVYLLLTHPDQFAKLKEDPSLLDGAIEETLRYEPPVTLIPRIALEDVEMGGETIHAGQIVQLSIASANRDAARFPDPDRFDITKKRGPTLSFGHGPHGCLGALLAMEEARISLATLFRRMPDLRLDDDREIKWYRNAANRGPDSLPVVF